MPLLQRFRKGVQVNAVCLYQSQLQGMAGLTQAVVNTSAFLYELLQLRGLFEYGSTLHVGKVWSELTVCLLRSLVKRDSKNLSNSFMPSFLYRVFIPFRYLMSNKSLLRRSISVSMRPGLIDNSAHFLLFLLCQFNIRRSPVLLETM